MIFTEFSHFLGPMVMPEAHVGPYSWDWGDHVRFRLPNLNQG